VDYQVRFAPAAAEDLQRLFDFLAEQDMDAAKRARVVIGQAIGLLQSFPFSCRKASPENPFLRELVISFGSYGYVALFEVENSKTVTVLAVRHQREEDFH
jgi:plasmid stabilization system protein ParE